MNERDLERQGEVAELLLNAARAFAETLEPERVYERFHELLADVVRHDGVVVSSYEADDDLIRCEYAWVEGNRLDPAILPPVRLNREGGGMQSQVIVTGEPLLVNDVAERVQEPGGTYYDVDREGHVRKLPDTGPPGTQAAMMIPVTHEGSVVGVVQVMSDREVYSAEQLDLVGGLVAQMGVAVRNARLQKERRRLEAAEAAARAVAAEREQAAHVLEAVGDGIFLLGGDGTVRLWNRAAELITGIAADAICDRSIVVAFPRWAELGDQIPVAERGRAGRSVTLPVEVGDRDLWLSFVAVTGEDGVVYAFRDLTSERRLEEEKSDFIATISHELRTPMAAVYGAAETLLRRELSPERSRDLLEVIASQATRLREITERVLLATQLDRGDVALGRGPVDIADVVRTSVDAIRPQLSPAVSLDVDLAPEVGAASGDADRIQQVLINLLDNALKYGRGTVTVRSEATNGTVRISVADTGPGITAAEQGRIFDKFYRVDPQLTHAPSGTGLGLYISRELVQRMGGRLNVKSAPGAGATFVVELPRA